MITQNRNEQLDQFLRVVNINCEKFQRNFTSPDEGHKMTLVGQCKIRMELKLQTFGKSLSFIVKLHLVVNLTNCYCIIPNLVRNYTQRGTKIPALDGKFN